jgi:hypothetical protein
VPEVWVRAPNLEIDIDEVSVLKLYETTLYGRISSNIDMQKLIVVFLRLVYKWQNTGIDLDVRPKSEALVLHTSCIGSVTLGVHW